MQENWWKEVVVYQVYPRSFQDTNGDGIGDIKGLLSRLDYLKELGIDLVWLSPVYLSPNADNGYDISDYRAIDPQYGTMEDVEALIRELHKRGMKLIMDFIVNHTSDEHPWFQQAKSSRDNPYHDYYIWKDGEKGVLPNNWRSHFSGSVWEYIEELGQYYLHIFHKKQPDLNWENPKVIEEVNQICEFWLKKGIDGFRMDVINFLSKAEGLPSVKGGEGLVSGKQYYMNGPKIHEYIKQMYQSVLCHYNIMTVGEAHSVTTDLALEYVGEGRNELNMVFQFEHMMVDCEDGNKWNRIPWKLSKLKKILSKWQNELHEKGWNSLYLCNHDRPRSVSRFGNDKEYWKESAKLLATMLHTMQGTPYVYQGEEIGMTNMAFSDISDYRDVQSLNLYEELQEKGIPNEEIMKKLHEGSRDNARTPMQWDTTPNGGFSTGNPWIKVNPNYSTINVSAQEEDSDSILEYYKRIIALRKKTPVVIYGSFKEYYPEDEKLYVYRRSYKGTTLFVALNFSRDRLILQIPEEIKVNTSKIYIANYKEVLVAREMELRPYEAIALIMA